MTAGTLYAGDTDAYFRNRAACVAARLAAQIDADERCKPLLDARADLVFHGDAFTGLTPGHAGRNYLLSWAITAAIKQIEAAILDEVGTVSAEHNLFDGVDPADCPLDDLKTMVRNHREELKRIAA